MESTPLNLNKKPRKSPKRYSHHDKIQYIESWQQSGLNRSQFCRQEGLSIASFCNWVQRQIPSVKRVSKPSKPVSQTPWLPVKLIADQPKVVGIIEVVLANGTCIKFPSDIPMATIKTLIPGL